MGYLSQAAVQPSFEHLFAEFTMRKLLSGFLAVALFAVAAPAMAQVAPHHHHKARHHHAHHHPHHHVAPHS